MAVYVDDIGIPARVGALSGRWSHLTADTPDELHEFAARLGLRRAWFQDPTVTGKPRAEPGTRLAENFHYDVTAGKRAQAIRLGATPVPWRDLPEITTARWERRGAAGQLPRTGDLTPLHEGATSMFISEAHYTVPPTSHMPAPLVLYVAAHVPKAEKPSVVGGAYSDFDILLSSDFHARIFHSPVALSHEEAAASVALLIADGRGPAPVTPAVAQHLRQWAHQRTSPGKSPLLPPNGAELRECR